MTEGKFHGRVALVTGGTQGLGAAVARRFIAGGARVMITGRSKERGDGQVRSLREAGGEAAFVAADLSDPDDCRLAVEETLARFGALDILVNSAADTRRSDIRSLSVELFDYQYALNVRAPLLLTQHALAALRKDHGVVINIGSINGRIGAPSLLSYSATKGALMTASRNLALALSRERVRVYCLNVGWMDSDGERALQASLGMPEDYMDVEGAKRPIGRLIAPADVASVCAFLASDEARPFSGAVIELEQFPAGSA